MKWIYTYLIFIFFCFNTRAQKAGQSFLKEFNKASPSEKVKLVASKSYAELDQVYPFIKDTLAAIKKSAYADASLYRLKFYFDKIDAGIQAHNQNYIRAILILENCLRNHSADINDSLKCIVELKNMFIKLKNYSKAIELCYVLEKKWARKSDTVDINYGTGKSKIYYHLGLIEKAIQERRKEFNRLDFKTDTNALVSYYNDIGVFYNVLKQSDSAEFYFVKAKWLLEKMRYPAINEMFINFFKALVDGNLGLAYYNKGRTQDAIPLLKRDIYFSMKSNNFESALNSQLLLIRCYIVLNEKNTAGRYLDSAEILIRDEIPDMQPKLKFLLTKAEYYTATGNHKTANQSYNEYVALSRKALEIENAQQHANENISLSVEQKEIELNEKDNLLKEAQLKEAKQKSYEAYLFTGILILLLVVGLLVYNNQGVKKREVQLSIKNMQISAQKQVIEQALKDKEILIKEIHHRVKNNLQIITSMLSLQIAKVDDEKTGLILRDARQRISSIALTHQMLYQKENLSNINLGEYIERLVRQVEFLMPSSNVKLITAISSQGSRLTIDNAVPLGLLINEMLTNAYKHAFPEDAKGEITVTLVEHEQTFTLAISDNGIGLPTDFDSTERKTLGMELIYILAEQLDSQLTIENVSGTMYTLQIKKTN
ncbi:MAG TPA: sensor histidine kinase [Bacteroidia bacterium]|nr:sensor histidine kinase [Bacteroidia bacterium]